MFCCCIRKPSLNEICARGCRHRVSANHFTISTNSRAGKTAVPHHRLPCSFASSLATRHVCHYHAATINASVYYYMYYLTILTVCRECNRNLHIFLLIFPPCSLSSSILQLLHDAACNFCSSISLIFIAYVCLFTLTVS